MMITIQHFQNKERLISVATDIISTQLLEDLNASGKASLLVSGGSTPGPVYKNLSTLDIAWNKVDVGLVDERWVNESDLGSNAALIRKTLLQGPASRARFTPMKTRHSLAVDAQPSVERKYKQIPQPFSAAVLGMGGDGHTASWFPGAQGLENSLNVHNQNLVQAITAIPTTVTGAYTERMTLTRTALSNCNRALLLITGADKLNVLKMAMHDKASSLPIRTGIDALNDRLTILYAP